MSNKTAATSLPKICKTDQNHIQSYHTDIRFESLLLITFLAFIQLFMYGCNKKEELPPKIETRSSHGAKKVTTIVVPPEVSKGWKNVTIAILNKPTMAQKKYTVPIGGKLSIPSSQMTIEVETFLPAFIMQGTTITSNSNKLANPAAKVRISEKNSTIFQGWLFSMHPNSHVLIHPVYGFSLISAQPAVK